MTSTPIEYSKYQNREVTEFICEELLYDYLVGALDQERKLAIEKALLESKKLQKQLQLMKQSLELAKTLKEFDVEDGLLNDFREVKGPFEQFLDEVRFRHWPFGVRWSVEVVIVLGFVSFTLYAVPWSKLMRFENFGQSPGYTLAQIEKNEKPSETSENQTVASNGTSDPATIFKDESAESKNTADNKNSKQAQPVSGQTVVAPTVAGKDPAIPASNNAGIKTTIANLSATTENIPASAKNSAEIKKENQNLGTPKTGQGLSNAGLSATTTAASATAVANATNNGAAAVQSGFLYRGSMKLTGTEMNGPKITERILQLGGRKAGEVDLGWRKTPTVLYYHFTIPESKQGELETIFNSFGKIRLAKEKHPRVMPEGISRYIIEVEEGQ